jgi:hypothetical protein
MDFKRLLSPGLVLFILSPVVAELISGSSPPLVFFNPFLLVINIVLYGSGAILVRELAFRWKKGWPSIMILGAAYGLIEEGPGLKSLFNPNYPGVDGAFGRWMGVNWIWTVGMTAYHVVISIAVPILLVTLMFPEKRDQPWVKGRTLAILAALLALDAGFLNLVFAPYSPGPELYILTLGAIAALIVLAGIFPHPYFKPVSVKAPKVLWMFLFGFLWTILLYLTTLIPAALKLPVPVVIAIVLAYYALSALVFLKVTGNGSALTDRHKLALASGFIGIFILGAPVREIFGARGMLIVGIGAAVLLYLISRRNREEVAQWTGT